MNKTYLILNDTQYVSSREAGRLVGYTKDYVCRLCREGAIDGEMVGNTWYVKRRSIENFADKKREEKILLQEQLVAERKREYRQAAFKQTLQKYYDADFVNRVGAFIFSVTLIFGGFFFFQDGHASKVAEFYINQGREVVSYARQQAQGTFLSLVTVDERFVKGFTKRQVAAELFFDDAISSFSKTPTIQRTFTTVESRRISARKEYSTSNERTLRSFSQSANVFSSSLNLESIARAVNQTIDDGMYEIVLLFQDDPVEVFYPRGVLVEGDVDVEVTVEEPVSGSTVVVERPQTIVQNITNQVDVQGVTQEELDAAIDALELKLSGLTSSNTVRTVTNYQTIALTNNIDKLGSVTIDNSSILSSTISGSDILTSTFSGTSVSTESLSVTGTGTTSIAGTLDVDGIGTSTFANGIDLSDGCFAIDGTCISGSGGSSLFTDGGDTTYLTATGDNLAVGTTTAYSKLTVWGNSTGNIFETVTSASSSALTVSATGFGTTTVTGLNINGSATTTSNVGYNITSGCFAVNGVCVSGASGGSGDPFAWTPTAYGVSTSTTLGFLSGFISTASSTITKPLHLGDIIHFSGTSSVPYQEGNFYYNPNEQTVELHNDISDVELQIGRENWIRVINRTGATITNGSVLYASSTDPATGLVRADLAQANNNVTSRVIGLATNDIANGAQGEVTQFGFVNDIDTSGFATSAPLFLDWLTPGLATTSEPVSPNFTIYLGFTASSSASNGSIFVTTVGNTGGAAAGDSTETVIRARKNSAGTITTGDAVYLAGYNAGLDTFLVELADADALTATSSIGIARDTFTNSTNGDVVISGRVTGIDTSSFSINDTLYLSTTAGGLTTTRPTGTACVQALAKVARSNASNGILLVTGAGRCNDVPNYTNIEMIFQNGFISQASTTIANLFVTNATTTNATTTNLNISSDFWLNSELFTDLTGTGLSNNSGTLSLNAGFSDLLGVSTSSDATGDIYYLNAAGSIVNLGVGSNGQVLKVTGGLPAWGADNTGGAGGSGLWATTTNDQIVYPADTADIVVIGNNATSSTNTIFEVQNGNAYFTGSVGIGNHDFNEKLNVQGEIAAQFFTATSTAATSTFPRADFTTAFRLGTDYITDLTGTGLQLNGSTLETTLGTSIDISDETNLAATWPIVLTNDTLSWDGLATTTGFSNNEIVLTNGSGDLYTVASSSLDLPNTALQNSTISGVALGGTLGALTNDATLNGSSYDGSGAVSDWGINLANANNWTALQTFTNASSSLLSVTNTAYFGGTATSTFDSAGNLALAPAATLTIDSQTISSLTDDPTLTNSGGNLQVVDVNCTDCLNATEIEDVYLLNNADDVTTGSLTATEFIANDATATSTFAGFVSTDGTTGGYRIDGITVLQASSTNLSTFVGQNAGKVNAADGTSNVAVGWNALAVNTTGDDNIAIGALALDSNISGSSNIAIGSSALTANTGNTNLAIGTQALSSNVGGSNNTAVGWQALAVNTSGVFNVALGQEALRNNNTGGSNVAVGYQAGSSPSSNAISNSTFVGYQAGTGVTTGDNNLLLGYQVGDALTTGSNNIAIGYDIDLPSNTTSNQLSIGNLIFGTGIDGTGTTVSSGNIGIGTSSPYSKLTVWGASTGNIFEAVTSASSTALAVSATGFSTTTVTGLNINGSATTTSNVGYNITSGCFAVNGVCVVDTDTQLAFSFDSAPEYGASAVSTSTLIAFEGGLIGTASSTFTALLNFTNATGTQLTLTDIFLGGDHINEFAGTGLTVSGNALTADLGTDISAGEIADGDHGDFTYSSGSATLDASTVSDNEIDYTTVTLADFTNDAGYSQLTYSFPGSITDFGNTNATSTQVGFSGGIISTASSTITNLFSRNATTTNATTTNLNISSLTASRLISGDSTKNVVSVADLTTWVTTGDGVDSTDDGDGTVTLAFDCSDVASTGLTCVGEDLTTDLGSTVDLSSSEVDDTFTDGSVLFWGTNAIAEDNASFFFDNTSNQLGVGTSSVTSLATLTVAATSTDTTKVISFLNDTSAEVASITDEGLLTVANGITISGGNFTFGGVAFTGPTGIDTTLVSGTAGTPGNCAEWDANGDLIDSGGTCGGGSSVWTASSDFNYITTSASDRVFIGTSTDSTTKQLATLTVSATSTDTTNIASFFDSTDTELFTFTSSGRFGVASSSPTAAFVVGGTSATSTFDGSIDVGSGALQYDYGTNKTVIERLDLGPISFDDDAGKVSWVDLPITTASATGTAQAFSAQIDSNELLTVWGEASGEVSGELTKARVVIGTSTDTVLSSTNIPYGSLIIADGILCVDDGGGENCDDAQRFAGGLYATSTTVTAIDLAENYPTYDVGLRAGDVAMLDPEHPVFVKRYVPGVGGTPIGIISTSPGVLLGGFGDDQYPNERKVPVTLSGRVPLKVTGEGGAIAVGDRITVSSTQIGFGAKATTSGSVIGIALEPFTAATSTATSTILAFVDLDEDIHKNEFFVQNGRVGIGTTTPTYKLQVGGDIAGTGFINVSTRAVKTNINHLSEADSASILEKLRGIEVATYHYIDEQEDDPLRLGLIAEEAPSEVLSVSGDGVDLYKLSAFTLAGVQELSRKVDTFEDRLSAIETRLGMSNTAASSSTQATTTTSVSFGSVIDALTSFGIEFVDGITHVVNLAVATMTVGTTEQPSGITLFDEVTGDPYCFRVRNGEAVTTSGSCAPSETDNPEPTDPNQDTEAPTFKIIGNNPAQVRIGATYSDLGAIVSDNVNDNLGYAVLLDGVEVSQVEIDTSTSSTHIVTYLAEDQAGNIGTAERTVVVGDGGSTPETDTPTEPTPDDTTTATTTDETITPTDETTEDTATTTPETSVDTTISTSTEESIETTTTTTTEEVVAEEVIVSTSTPSTQVEDTTSTSTSDTIGTTEEMVDEVATSTSNH